MLRLMLHYVSKMGPMVSGDTILLIHNVDRFLSSLGVYFIDICCLSVKESYQTQIDTVVSINVIICFQAW